MNQVVFESPLLNPAILPLRAAETVSALGSTLVVAPHPDDESLGCGGAIALLRSWGCSVSVLVVSDGTRSHPNSRKYPAPALKVLRENETRSALTILGVESDRISFLSLPDGAIPDSGAVGFESAVSWCREYLTTVKPKTIFLPWRFDPHPDHRATWQLIHSAIAPTVSPHMIEYPIWDWDPEQRGSLPFNQVIGWRLDISSVLELKLQAIAAYRSQLTNLIDDDPEGFRLEPEMLANFSRSWEVYLEAQ